MTTFLDLSRLEPNLLAAYNAEAAAERVRLDAHNAEAARYRGAAPSGFGPDPIRPRTTDELLERAKARVASRKAWEARPEHALMMEVARVQALAVEVHEHGERVRAAISRSPSNERRRIHKELLDAQAVATNLLYAICEAQNALCDVPEADEVPEAYAMARNIVEFVRAAQ